MMIEAACMYIIYLDKQGDDDEMLVMMIIKVMITAIQQINHPVQDNLASRAASLSR